MKLCLSSRRLHKSLGERLVLARALARITAPLGEAVGTLAGFGLLSISSKSIHESARSQLCPKMATTKKMTPKKVGLKNTKAKGKSGVALSKQERVDDAIMNVSHQHPSTGIPTHAGKTKHVQTNDSSIVSKRSVCKLYMPNEPDFYEPFVQKFVRRNPLINRGYWLRMHAIEQVVRRFLQEDDGKSKVVVNLGCG